MDVEHVYQVVIDLVDTRRVVMDAAGNLEKPLPFVGVM
jgi:hypothetical protein